MLLPEGWKLPTGTMVIVQNSAWTLFEPFSVAANKPFLENWAALWKEPRHYYAASGTFVWQPLSPCLAWGQFRLKTPRLAEGDGWPPTAMTTHGNPTSRVKGTGHTAGKIFSYSQEPGNRNGECT